MSDKIYYLVAFTVFFLACGMASTPPLDEPIVEILDAQPQTSIFENASRDNPLVIRSEAEAATRFAKDQLGNLLRQVDFNKQFVLVFAWRGSGQDLLKFDVAESFPEQIYFRYKPGLSRDLRPHVHVYAVRSNVSWHPPKPVAGFEPGVETDEFIKVEVQGKLNAQVMAIGGETTGITITAKGITWELDFGDDGKSRGKAQQLHNQIVNVKGTLAVKRGVEIASRYVVHVKSLRQSR